MNFLFIGDIIGKSGRETVKKVLPSLKKEYEIDITIANAENSAHGNGITKRVYEELIYDCKIDVLTGGNHIWDKREIFKELASLDKLVRPLNFLRGNPGKGYLNFTYKDQNILVFNLMGRVFLPPYNDPFEASERLLEKFQAQKNSHIFLDFHAEASSEKVALAWYLDGKLSAIAGTHTHVQTADERILPKGTAYITDTGFTGSQNSVIGVQIEPVLKRFLTMLPDKFTPEEAPPYQFNAFFFATNEFGKASEIKRIFKILE